MVSRFYAVKDVLVGSFMVPTIMPNDNVAKRSLAQAAKEPGQFKDNWKDIQLWYLYSLDTDTGLIIENLPYLIGNLADYVEVGPDEYKDK